MQAQTCKIQMLRFIKIQIEETLAVSIDWSNVAPDNVLHRFAGSSSWFDERDGFGPGWTSSKVASEVVEEAFIFELHNGSLCLKRL